jgi:hypothetical protein
MRYKSWNSEAGCREGFERRALRAGDVGWLLVLGTTSFIRIYRLGMLAEPSAKKSWRVRGLDQRRHDWLRLATAFRPEYPLLGGDFPLISRQPSNSGKGGNSAQGTYRGGGAVQQGSLELYRTSIPNMTTSMPRKCQDLARLGIPGHCSHSTTKIHPNHPSQASFAHDVAPWHGWAVTPPAMVLYDQVNLGY